ncbi:hypothetical protein CIK05_14880 [Bdellovibrio sp. qaytius]|nr:hypothetical protein CIK05_14880 [Bdellovibrio sp. qaytius]
MKPNYRKIKFNKDSTEYFHLNFAFAVHSLFPELDWLLINLHLRRLSDQYSIELHAFVMMSTHSHLLFKSSQQNENYFTDALLNNLKVTGAESTLVEPITNMSQYLNTYKYIYRNPVEARLVQNCEEYRFSSLNGLLGQSELITPVIDPLSVAQNPNKILRWLNNYFEKKLFHFNSAEM